MTKGFFGFEIEFVKAQGLSTVGQKTVPMFGYFAKIEVEQIKKIR